MEFSMYDHFPPELAGEWDALVERSHTNGPFLRYDYQKLWWDARGGGEWPTANLVLVIAREADRLVGIAPLFHTPDHQGKPRLMIVGSVEVSDYLDLVAEPQDMPAFAAGLLEFLKLASLPEWAGLDLYNILDNSPSLGALKEAASSLGWHAEETRAYHCPYIPIPGDWEAYLAGIDKKQRHEIRRKMRRLRDSEVPNRWYLVEDASTLEAEIDGFFALMEQDENKARFLTPMMREFMRANIRWAFEHQLLFLAFLEIKGEKAAGYLAYDYLNRLWVYNSGINRTCIEYSPGWVLLGDILKWCNDSHREAFDFLRGDEEYKYRFGAVDRFVMRLTIDK